MKKTIRLVPGFTLVASMFSLVEAQEELIDMTRILVTAESQNGADFGPENTLDGETLEGLKTGDVEPPDRPEGHQNNHWITANGVLTAELTFDLGGSYNMTRLEILNTSNTNWNDRETDFVTIEGSTDGGETYDIVSDEFQLQDYTLGFQSFDFMEEDVTHVRLFVINDALEGTNTGTEDVAVGLNEVRLYAEPLEDSDGDGLTDNWEIEHFGDLSRDGSEDEEPDGLTNAEEFEEQTDPNESDTDLDELSDGDEVKVHFTDPRNDDTDGDTLFDGEEVDEFGTDPTKTDSDDDRLDDEVEVNLHQTNPLKEDTDDDGISDFVEVNDPNLDPLVPNERPGLLSPLSISVTADSELVDGSGDFSVSNLVDDLILEGFQRDGDIGPPERPAGHQSNHWMAIDDVFTAKATFDLGGAYDLKRLEILNTSNTNWNDAETNTFTVAASTDGGTIYSDPTAAITLQDYVDGFQVVPFVLNGVTHVEIEVTNVEENPGEERRVGLNEVRFYTIAALAPPEITGVEYVVGGTEAQITWGSIPGEKYVVEYSDSLKDDEWEAVEEETDAAEEGNMTSITHTFSPAEPVVQRFYRVRRL